MNLRRRWSIPLGSAVCTVALALAATAAPNRTGAPARAAHPVEIASPDSAPPRLPHSVWPTSQSVDLTLDPEQTGYRGRVTIELDARERTREIRFHTRALTLDQVTLRGSTAEVKITAIERLVPDQTRLTLAADLAPGAYTLTVSFHNAYNTKATSLYRVVTGGHSYLFTQFEDTEAREAFPCWDEPEFKIPWDVTLEVPAADLAVGNAPITNEKTQGASKRVTFARTRPLPSYLIAVAVGPFETVPIPGLSVPGRVVTVQGASAMAAEAVRITPPILKSLERYFGRPYPYEKLDLIAAPEFLFGAMENAGAVVFADRRLLIDPRSVSPEQRRGMSSVVAHELAHMWFGDLVTMRWWDDLWLNESFASWMATKVMDDVLPEFHDGTTTLYGVQRAFTIDSRLSTRAMREKVLGSTNLAQTASELAYNKGEAVLTMFEGWLGAEKFRAGVVQYLADHEWKNAEGADLWSALGRVSGDDVPAAMTSFLDAAGAPLVTVEPLAAGKVRLSQRRFLTMGESASDARPWRVPVILRYPAPGGSRTLRVWLTRPDTVVDLGLASTPKWIEPNAGASGYYRWRLPEAMLDAMVAARAELSSRERIDLVANLTAQLRAGVLHGDRYLEFLATLADDESPEVVRYAIGAIAETKTALETPATGTAYANYVRSTLQPVVARIGMRPADGESVGVALARPGLLRLLATSGSDEKVLEYAESLSRDYRANPASVPASLVEFGVVAGAARGDRALFDDYRKRFETTTVPAERPLYLGGLGTIRDPDLRREALAYTIEGPLRPHERLMIPSATAGNALGVDQRSGASYPDAVAEWMLQNFGRLRETMPPNFTTRIMGLGGGCSEERLSKLRTFFAEPDHRMQGGENTLRRMADGMEECRQLHDRESERVERWLQTRTPQP